MDSDSGMVSGMDNPEKRDNVLPFAYPGMGPRIGPAERWMVENSPHKTIAEVAAEYAHQITHKIIGTSKVFATLEEMEILEAEVTKITIDFILDVIGIGPQE